jgi:hypothetical protein
MAGYVRPQVRYVRARSKMQRKSRSGDKMIRLGPDKLTISKLDNIELREITEITRSNLNSGIQI